MADQRDVIHRALVGQGDKPPTCVPPEEAAKAMARKPGHNPPGEPVYEEIRPGCWIILEEK
jgi:hypothetical protein